MTAGLRDLRLGEDLSIIVNGLADVIDTANGRSYIIIRTDSGIRLKIPLVKGVEVMKQSTGEYVNLP